MQIKTALESGTEVVVAGVEFGRSLCFAPDWKCSDAAVLFDRNSGDYWVVSSSAKSILKLLQAGGPLALPSLYQQLYMLVPEVDWAADLLPTLNSLADNRLVKTSSRTFG